ncbi:hypothetical protein F4553_006869 [Allocatelliglobosispora scoriae]|uniref:Iron-containing redox enzyme family protein n=1 Tax=Allocatelliglobosispora scoriae TaxID=643052 RepID=A0A841C0H7_9ACTN|nr:iron-containing redox enzyme family protein [Allocatelliglobosispora scoriae]MBB5873435.1 hypothetical protein [Allocatelliglobosispora scoriae]
MRLPEPRGPVSATLITLLRADTEPAPMPGFGDGDPLVDDDLQLTLTICYELHYGGFDEVDDAWEWHPGVLAVRAEAERRFERAVRDLVGSPAPVPAAEIPAALTALTAETDGPSLSRYVQRHATLDQFREFVVHKSLYQLKEADPHTFAIPRLTGRAKAALVEIQIDEYGSGRLDRMHSELFRTTMRHLGLDAAYGAYLDRLPATSLAINNLISMFALHRRLRGALAGQLAAFEMTSSLPNSRYGNGLRRLGGDAEATLFYDEHVAADAVHEQIAAHDLCGGLVAAEPHLSSDVLFGAAAAEALGGRVGRRMLADWEHGASSLRPGSPDLPVTDGAVLVGVAG